MPGLPAPRDLVNVGGVGTGGIESAGQRLVRATTPPGSVQVSQTRVQKLTDEVASGLYQPTPHQIAAAIIAAARKRSNA